MPLTTTWIRRETEPTLGYLCYPETAKKPLPAVLVIQEAWGVDAHIEDVTRRFAQAGYAAFAPDLFTKAGRRLPALAHDRVEELKAFVATIPPTAWRDPAARDAELAKLTEPLRSRVNESFGALMANVGGLAAFIPTLLGATRWLREECEVTRGMPIGSVGFCMGGGLSGLLACHDPLLAAAVVFYGSAPPLELVTQVQCPVLGFYGGLDERINAMVPPFRDAMKAAGKRFEDVTYEGVQHAFFNDSRSAYDVAAVRDAFARTLGFFRAHLA